MKLPYKLLLLYNEPEAIYSNYTGKFFNGNLSTKSEDENLGYLDIIYKILCDNFAVVEKMSFGKNIIEEVSYIKSYSPDLIFNLVESIKGYSYLEGSAAGLFEILNVNYTGNKPDCLYNCLNKYLTKLILKANKINTPNFIIVDKNQKLHKNIFVDLKFPVITKLNEEDASIGISEESICYNIKDLLFRLDFLFENYSHKVLVEEYINGREFNVAILDGEVLPISEINFENLDPGLPKIVTYEAKWQPESEYYKNTIPICPANIDSNLERQIKEVALHSYRALNCRDYARVDMRVNENGNVYVIEINPNPDIAPDAGFARCAKVAGIDYDELIAKIATIAINRGKNDQSL